MAEENLETLSQKACSLEDQYNISFCGGFEQKKQGMCKDLPYHGKLVAESI